MNSDNQQFKVHSGYYQLEKEYPEAYSNFLVSRSKLSRSCPEEWKSACQARLESLKSLLEDYQPDRVKQEIFEKCEGYSKGLKNLIECKSRLYSIKTNKLLLESVKIESFLSNLNRFT